MNELKLDFVNKEITAWGGLSIMQKLIEKTGFLEKIRSLPLPAQGSNRGYSPDQLLIQFMYSLWCGASRYAHLDVSRFDKTIQKLFGWKWMPEHKAFQRYFQKFTMADIHNVFGGLYSWCFEQLQFDNFTLDIDSSVVTSYGFQDAANKGYNKSKPGRNSDHPLMEQRQLWLA